MAPYATFQLTNCWQTETGYGCWKYRRMGDTHRPAIGAGFLRTSTMSNDDHRQEPRVRLVGEPQAVPVFNCRVIVSRDPAGMLLASSRSRDSAKSRSPTRSSPASTPLASGHLPFAALWEASTRRRLGRFAGKLRLSTRVALEEPAPWLRLGRCDERAESTLRPALLRPRSSGPG
jgi:hypothetical protein